MRRLYVAKNFASNRLKLKFRKEDRMAGLELSGACLWEEKLDLNPPFWRTWLHNGGNKGCNHGWPAILRRGVIRAIARSHQSKMRLCRQCFQTACIIKQNLKKQTHNHLFPSITLEYHQLTYITTCSHLMINVLLTRARCLHQKCVQGPVRSKI
jgi:hypothetical protein